MHKHISDVRIVLQRMRRGCNSTVSASPYISMHKHDLWDEYFSFRLTLLHYVCDAMLVTSLFRDITESQTLFFIFFRCVFKRSHANSQEKHKENLAVAFYRSCIQNAVVRQCFLQLFKRRKQGFLKSLSFNFVRFCVSNMVLLTARNGLNDKIGTKRNHASL